MDSGKVERIVGHHKAAVHRGATGGWVEPLRRWLDGSIARGEIGPAIPPVTAARVTEGDRGVVFDPQGSPRLSGERNLSADHGETIQ
jgi:hypothetical protein